MSLRSALRAFAPALALSVAGLTVACADGPTSPAAPTASATPAFGTTSTTTSTVTSTASKTSASTVFVGDTAVTTIYLAPASSSVSFDLRYGHKISFPRQGSSVCDLATSSYGATEWDTPCTPSATTVKVTAKVWHDALGLAHTDFQPAMRFVPTDNVRLDMQNKNGFMSPGMRIDFCTSAGCINEAATDPSVATYGDAKAAKLYRRIKHFSGYTITAM